MYRKRYLSIPAALAMLSLVVMGPRPAAAAETVIDIPTNWSRYQVLESEIYTVQAGAGTFRVVLGEIPANAFSLVMMVEPETSKVLLSKTLLPADNVAEVVLTKGGTFQLMVAPNQAVAVTLRGNDLSASPHVPAIQLSGERRLETRNQPFVIEPVLVNPEITESVTYMLNQEVLNPQALRQDGTLASIAIDPATMADGIYQLVVTGTAKGSGNVGVNGRTFLVDRQPAFSDVVDHWARQPVEVLAHLEIVNGTGDGKFVPDRPVTRAEFAKMIALTLGLDAGPERPAPFADMPDDWSTASIYAMEQNGLMQGVVVDGKRYFEPKRPITRAEAVTVIGRVLGIAEADIAAETPSFSDFDQVPDWAKPSVALLAEHSWLNGYPDGTFRPSENLERDETAAVIAKFLGL